MLVGSVAIEYRNSRVAGLVIQEIQRIFQPLQLASDPHPVDLRFSAFYNLDLLALFSREREILGDGFDRQDPILLQY